MAVEMLQLSMAQLRESFNARMAHFESELPKTSNTSAATSSALATEFGLFKVFVKETLSTLQCQIDLLASQVDSLEMQTRRKMLLIHGVPEQPKEQLAEQVVDIVKEHLKLPEFTTDDIRRCHRMGRTAGSNKSRAIIIKLQTVACRDRLWFSKTKFKGSDIVVSEFLTKQRHVVFSAARERFGVTNCWTREGSIFVASGDGSRHRVVSLSELKKIPSTADEQRSEKPTTAGKTTAKSKRTVHKK